MKKIELIKQKFGLLLLSIMMIFISSTIKAQMPAAITIDPPDATAYDEITLTFDPELACFQFANLTGLPYIAIHSGVKIYMQNSWQYGVGFDAIGANGQYPYMMPTGDGKYSTTYTPSEFYGIPYGLMVTHILAVFNNGIDWSQDGRDYIPNSAGCSDFFIPINVVGNGSEFHFNLNMNKMISNGNFDPYYDNVYLIVNDVGSYYMSDWNWDGIYEIYYNIGSYPDSCISYHYSINLIQYEIVSRDVASETGQVYLEDWWENDASPHITFIVDMVDQMLMGTFIEGIDYVDIVGTMNNWIGTFSPGGIGWGTYSFSFYPDPGPIEYKFRINGDWSTVEFTSSGPNRMTWSKPGSVVLGHCYNDYDANTWPATFEVDMNAEISAGNFDPSTDYLDVAGTFNNWDAHCVLFDRDWTEPGIYTANILVDKLDPYIEFKFRINGDWWTSEFPLGGPNRYWTVQDTAGGYVNLFQCIYNITDVPYPPYVYDLFISGELVVGEEITGNYTYYDPNADPEGASLYQWYRSDNPSGTNSVQIQGAVFQSYLIAEEDYGNYLIFVVTPVSLTGDPSVGYSTGVVSGQVGYTNISEVKIKAIQLYPNPVNDELTISSTAIKANALLSIFTLTGEKLLERQLTNTETQIDISTLPRGVYFVRVQDERIVKVMKFIKE